MEGQTNEDKLSVLNTIFGNDLTQSVISNALNEHDNQFDPTVEKLLTVPSNKAKPPPPQPAGPMDGKAIERLHTMFGDLTQSVITTVYESNKRDVEGTVDTLLNMTSNEVASGARRDAEIARQEQELRAYEEFMSRQEQERKAEHRRRVEAEEAQKKADQEKKMRDERDKALKEQERMLVEFQRKKAEEQERSQEVAAVEARKKAEEQGRKKVEEQEKKRAEEQERKKAEEQQRRKIEEEKKRAEEKESAEKQKEAAMLEQRRRLAKEEEMLAQEKKRLEQEILAQEKKRFDEERKMAEERRLHEERLVLKRLEEENQILQKQKKLAEEERKKIESRMKTDVQRDEEEKRRLIEHEKRFLEEQEQMKRSWEEKVRKLENERKLEEKRRMEEEAKRMEAKREEEEIRARQEADMRKILELERLKLDEQRKRVEEEKKLAEERLRVMEEAALKREEEEKERQRQEEERKRAEEERRREEEEKIRLLEEEEKEEERKRQELSKIVAQEKFAASAIMVPPAVNEPKVEIHVEVEGTDIRGEWTLLQGALPSPQAWLGLFARRSMNTYLGFQYVTGTSGDFSFKSLAPGHYEVRIFGSKLVTSRIAESIPVLIGPKVLNFSAQIQGDHVMLAYQLDPPATPTSRDWVGIYEKTQRRNKLYLSSTYGNPQGTVSAVLPRTPGEYEARLFVSGSKYSEQSIVDFTVVDNDHVTAEISEAVIKASWELRTVEPTNSDWIGLFCAGDVMNNKYLASAYTHGASAGSVEIPLPKDLAAGVYELRLFSSKVGKYTTFKVSNALTINGSA